VTAVPRLTIPKRIEKGRKLEEEDRKKRNIPPLPFMIVLPPHPHSPVPDRRGRTHGSGREENKRGERESREMEEARGEKW
jgi:hypothetical protein